MKKETLIGIGLINYMYQPIMNELFEQVTRTLVVYN